RESVAAVTPSSRESSSRASPRRRRRTASALRLEENRPRSFPDFCFPIGTPFRGHHAAVGCPRKSWCGGAGSFHALAIRYDGSVWAWRDDAVGQLGDTSVYRRSSPARVEKGSTGAPVEPRLSMGGFGSRSERPSEGPGSAPRHFNAISTHRGATG